MALIHTFAHDHAVISYKQNITPQYYSTITYHHVLEQSQSQIIHQSNEFNYMEETPQSISIETAVFVCCVDQQETGIETKISNDKDRDSESLMPVSSLSASPTAAMSNKKK